MILENIYKYFEKEISNKVIQNGHRILDLF